jgi:aquaporin Z
MEMQRRMAAEAFGTFWLVFGGCGSAMFAANFLGANETTTSLGIGFLGVSLAFGLTVFTMAYAVGHISGGHFNPAVTLGLIVAGKFDKKDAPVYLVAQLVGAVLAAACMYLILSGLDGFEIVSEQAGAFAANGYGDLSPGGYPMISALIAEVVLTAFFIIVILGVTSKAATPGVAGATIGLTLALIHLISIPITNTSVNPARSTSQALFAGGDYLPQLWLFWVAPLVGAAIGAAIWTYLLSDRQAEAAAA